MSSSLSTHVLDSTTGRPAAGMAVTLERATGSGATGWQAWGGGVTDIDGRLREFATGPVEAGFYRLTFDTAAWFAERDRDCFYPQVAITFAVGEPGHHHVPLLLAPYAYSTYRGS